MQFRLIEPDDHAALMRFWQQAPEIQLREDDQYLPFVRYLARNPGLSWLAHAQGEVIASVLVGHDGRRGYLQHLLVAPPWRGRGLARQLLARALTGLAEQGICKSHVLVLAAAPSALSFWQAQQQWCERDDVRLFSSKQVGS